MESIKYSMPVHSRSQLSESHYIRTIKLVEIAQKIVHESAARLKPHKRNESCVGQIDF